MNCGLIVSDQYLVTSAVPTLGAAAYSANDAVGGKMTFENAVFTGKSNGVIEAVTLYDLAKQGIALDLVLFSADFTATADNDAFDPSDADLANYLGHINVVSGSYAAFSDNSVATVQNLRIPFSISGTSLYGQIVTRGTPTYGVGDLKVFLRIRC